MDTAAKQQLVDKVVESIINDIEQGDITCLDEMLNSIPTPILLNFLPEATGSKQQLVDSVIENIESDIEAEDTATLSGMLNNVPSATLLKFLPEARDCMSPEDRNRKESQKCTCGHESFNEEALMDSDQDGVTISPDGSTNYDDAGNLEYGNGSFYRTSLSCGACGKQYILINKVLTEDNGDDLSEILVDLKEMGAAIIFDHEYQSEETRPLEHECHDISDKIIRSVLNRLDLADIARLKYSQLLTEGA